MRSLKIALFALMLLVGTGVVSQAVHAVAGLPEGFSFETVASSFNLPTTVSFAPDGRIFVAEKSGVVKIIKNGTVLGTPFITLSDINDAGDRGLIGMALDPNFSSNGYVYLGYTYESNAGNYGGEKTARVVRVTANGDQVVSGSEVILLGSVGGTASQPSCTDYPSGSDCLASDSLSHTIGGLRFGADDKLYVATGDGAGFTGLDEHAFRAQDLDHLSGKILRIDTDGSAASGNPFYTGNADDNRSKVWAYGVRNPYRFTVHPDDGRLIGGDVGWFTKEEVNHLQPGKNYGWPCREGVDPSVGGYTGFTQCSGFSGYTDPIYDYAHQGGSGAITGGAFALSSTYPSYFRGAYLYADFTLDFMKYLTIDGNSDVTAVNDFATDVAGPVDFVTGPDGLIYYLSIYSGELRRIAYDDGSVEQDPTAVATAATTNTAPYIGTFDASGSSDPQNEALAYSWTFGDGTTGLGSTPVHTYAAEGTYEVVLTVSTPRGATDSATIFITFEESTLGDDSAPFLETLSATPLGEKYIGTPIDFTATLGNAVDGDPFIVLYEIFDADNQSVEKLFFDTQSIPAGDEEDYEFSWLPEGLGSYYVSVGLFKNDWSDKVHPWIHSAFTFDVVDRSPGGPVCGNNILEDGEQCDDGNTIDGDSCSSVCTIEVAGPICGNNILEFPEQCDDGNITSGDGCSAVCLIETVAPICGNNVLEDGEQCDDGNLTDGDGCSAICGIEASGDGNVMPLAVTVTPENILVGDTATITVEMINTGAPDTVLVDIEVYDSAGSKVGQEFFNNETFATGQIKTYTYDWIMTSDDVFEVPVAVFEPDWTSLIKWYGASGLIVTGTNTGGEPICGNDILEVGEQCDDGNLTSGDGCSNTCTIEIAAPICGNNILEAGEECDDGNTVDGDSCSAICTIEVAGPICGNNILESPEQCDDGNLTNEDGCSNICLVEEVAPVCGNSILETGEQCDDGNLTSGDGCSAICLAEEESEEKIVIFDDAISSAWSNWSWNTNGPDVTDATGPEGVVSSLIELSYTSGWGGLYFHANEPLALETDDTLHFWIRADGSNATNNIAVSLYDTSNARITRLVLSDYIALTSSWQQVEIPISDFLTDDQLIGGVVLQDASGAAGEQFTIEDIAIRE